MCVATRWRMTSRSERPISGCVGVEARAETAGVSCCTAPISLRMGPLMMTTPCPTACRWSNGSCPSGRDGRAPRQRPRGILGFAPAITALIAACSAVTTTRGSGPRRGRYRARGRRRARVLDLLRRRRYDREPVGPTFVVVVLEQGVVVLIAVTFSGEVMEPRYSFRIGSSRTRPSRAERQGWVQHVDGYSREMDPVVAHSHL